MQHYADDGPKYIPIKQSVGSATPLKLKPYIIIILVFIYLQVADLMLQYWLDASDNVVLRINKLDNLFLSYSLKLNCLHNLFHCVARLILLFV